MEAFYFALALVTAGISMAMGSVALLIALNRAADKTYLHFGVLAWLLTLFILTPPLGFITADVAPYSTILLVKRIFIFGYYALLPWFIYHYTGRPGKAGPRVVSLISILSYFVMFSTTSNQPRPLWTYFALLIFTVNLAYGLSALMWMFRHGDKASAKWLAATMAFYTVLYIGAASNMTYATIYQVNLFGLQRYFPMHLHSLALMLIIGFRLQATAFNKLRLEKMVLAQRERWKTFLENSPLLILEVKRDGTILIANDFAASRLGVSKSAELIGLNWFDLFSSPSESRKVKDQWHDIIQPPSFPPVKGLFRVGHGGPVSISWLSLSSTADAGGSGNVALIGQDMTQQDSALVELSKLRLQVEKENINQLFREIPNSSGQIIGTSKAIGYTLQKAQQVAGTNATVLLEGETGVGKELFADFIQSQSVRKDKPFIKVNCSAMPADLIEDELFGHEKGAFTSAIASRTGRFELADGGTIFLDEIGELPLAVQPKLLRVLQQGDFERVGGQKTIRVDVRVIAATNRDLNAEVEAGRFRSDLLYRLNVFPVSIPPLRNRTEDLDLLTGHFIKNESEKYKKSFEQISKADLQRLREYSWPGNIRELRNLIERSVIQSDGDMLRLQFLQPAELDNSNGSSLEHVEKDHITKILNECNWKINGANGAAERLDMNPNTLRSRMKKLNITREGHVTGAARS